MGKDKRSKKDAIYEEEEVKNKNKAGRFIKPEKKEEVVEEIKVITLPEVITIKELAEKMKMQPSVIVKKLFLQGQMVTVNQEISYEEAENIAIDYDIMCEQEVKVDVIEELLKEDEEKAENMVERAPVICVMGHVDHGKTSLLDAIRKTNVTDKEAGGITQHIGAYMVEAGGRKITFLDTPGHEAFTAMRMRGANATDIAILVVAADDGVMPQTVEAINHAKAAGIEIIVAVNKIDKPNADLNRVKQELAEYELIPEDWGGSTVFAPVSAKTGEGIKELLDMVLLTADILELKANPKRKARGLVIEAELDKGRGPVATILMQKGTLKVGDFVSAGACYGKVRAMLDDKGRRVKEAGPSTPVEILGLNDVPEAGEVFIAHDSDKTAKSFADTYKAQNKVKKLEETKSKMSLDDVFSQIKEGNLKELNLIVKADVQGSVEAVKQSLIKLSNDEVVVKCIHGGVGAVNESDVSLAAASNAIIIGFNVRVDANAKETAEREGVDVRLYKVIYQAIDDVEAAMKGMLDPIFEEKVIGHAEVRQIFKASAVGNIAGSYVLDGIFQRGCKIRISREGEQIYEGELASLKRFKDDVKEVKAGYECGLVFEKFDAMQELDIVEAYIMVEVPR
jgi:translation initiation factor IF-2